MKIRNKQYNLTAIIAMLLIASLFSGCQLAKKEYSTAKISDQLCGVFVTIGTEGLNHINQSRNDSDFMQHLSTGNGVKFHNDSMFPDNMNPPSDNDNKINGIVNTDATAYFDGIKGYYMGLVYDNISDSNIKDSCFTADKAFRDRHSSVNVGNEVEEYSTVGSLYFSENANSIVHINPVYRRNDGTYYTEIVIGQQMGYLFNKDSNSRGEIYSQNISNSSTTTIDGKKHTLKNDYTVKFCVESEPQKILIKEMNKEDELIKTTEYKQSDSDKYIVNAATSYVIVEEYGNAASNDNKIERSIYSLTKGEKNDEVITHSCFYADDNGVMTAKELEFVYK